MKAVFLAVIVAVAVTASAEVVPASSPVYDYHRRFGIPDATKIKAAEEQANQRIVGGSVTDISVVPYQIGLVMQIMWIFSSVCGASLISTNRAITAAHCKFDGVNNAQSFTLVLGSNTIFFGGQRINVNVNDVVMHSAWNWDTAANDIAVMRINNGVTLSNLVQPIGLPGASDTFEGETALASGFGRTSDSGGISNSQVLSSVRLPVITNSECAATFGIWVHNSNICTSGAGGRGTCSGDSGGPLAVERNGRPILIGTTSYGALDGCEIGLPAAFARTTSYLDFIASI